MSIKKLLYILSDREKRAAAEAMNHKEGSPQYSGHMLEAFAYNDIIRLIKSPKYRKEIFKIVK